MVKKIAVLLTPRHIR